MEGALSVRTWVSDADRALPDSWSVQALVEFAGAAVPGQVLGSASWLVKSDVAATWARWFFDGLADSSRYVADRTLPIAALYQEISRSLAEMFPAAPRDEVRDLGRAITHAAWRDVQQRRLAGRWELSRREREELWFTQEPQVRCHWCGYLFTEDAKAHFLRRPAPGGPVVLPLLVDFLRPRGLIARDVAAEVDHVHPVASGGGNSADNLRLSCGWCNRTKSRYANLYDAASWSVGTLRHPRLGTVSLPQPLWIVRVVGVRRRCEWSSGCSATLDTHELFVAPRRLTGALNPLNASVYCSDHDPWAADRFVGAALLHSRQSASARRTNEVASRTAGSPTR